ncbi:MAG: D-alanine--D-alanine ligase [Clostridia bacterium]|nr:D-alanine--D-alanine ligase [Clostridia bacterium]
MSNTEKMNVAVIFGGQSSEHEVSRVSVTMVLNNIDREKYNVYMTGITKDGRWYLYEGAIDQIASGAWETSGKTTQAFLSPDAALHGMVIMREGGAETVRLDAVFPVMHGKNGEDGTVQGLCELAHIPCVGCDLTSSAVCLDKALTNTVLEYAGILQAKFIWFYATDFENRTDEMLEQIENGLGYPCFVKPANAGSSVGISKCADRGEVIDAVRKAALHDRKIVVEENITGQEVEVAVLGNDDPITSVVGEIIPAADWYDYDAKYNDEQSRLLIPANLSEETSELIRSRAVQAYKALGCSGMARVDFLVRKSDGQPMLNEPNTLPGFTEISMYPKLFEASGIGKKELIDRLISLAIERAGSR